MQLIKQCFGSRCVEFCMSVSITCPVTSLSSLTLALTLSLPCAKLQQLLRTTYTSLRLWLGLCELSFMLPRVLHGGITLNLGLRILTSN